MLHREIRWAAAQVLRSPSRLRYLLGDGLGPVLYLGRFLRTIVPLATRELSGIELLAQRIPDADLRREALASIRSKAYHVAGACILATFLPRTVRRHYVEAVVPLETIYDFLDNLCDRHPDVPVEAYPVLHQALKDALDPAAAPQDYYAKGPHGDDGDYLLSLVRRTQRAIRRLANHEVLLPHFREAAQYYSDLQTFKHYPQAERERACVAWYERNKGGFGDLTWFEFASAAGSQFQVYAPLYFAFRNEFDKIDIAYRAYFPAVSALHVLLDYFIDQAEDGEHGELNFVECYKNLYAFRARARLFVRRAFSGFKNLPSQERHRFVLRTMCLFYLSHPKVYEQGLDREAQALLEALA